MLSSDESLNDDALASHVSRFPSSLNPLMFRHRRWSLLDYVRCEYDIGSKARLVSGFGNRGTYILVKDASAPEERSNMAYFLYGGSTPKVHLYCGGLYRANDVVNAYFHTSGERTNLMVTAFFPLGFESWCQLVGNPAFGVRYARQDQRTSSVCGVHACSDAVGMLLSGTVKLSTHGNASALALVTQSSQLWSIATQWTLRRCTALYCLETNALHKAQLAVDVTDQMRIAISLSPKIGIEFEFKH